MDFLQTSLQHYLATDDAATRNAPHVVALLTSSTFESSHVSKWTNRVNALIRAREPGARWAGLLLAHRTATLSRVLLTSSAQVWITATLPILSRSEAVPIWKAAIKLLAYISLSTTSLPDFQRTVIHHTIPKLSTALVSLTEKNMGNIFSSLCMDTLSALVRAFPSLHRSVTDPMSALCLRLLDGTSYRTHQSVVSSASRLYASLHVTGGKVGGSALWRKGIDEAITYTRKSFDELRTTYTTGGVPQPAGEPERSITLAIDRLSSGTELLCAFLTSEVSRPVIVPVNAIIKLCIDVLSAEDNAQLRDDLDPALRTAEATLVPLIHLEGCKLTAIASKCLRTKVSPYFNQILSVAAHHLERKTILSQRLAIARMLSTLFTSCLPPSNPLLVGRLVKALLPSLTPLLSSHHAQHTSKGSEVVSSKRAGKQKVPGYDDDQVFKVSRDRLCESQEEAELVLTVLEVLPILVQTPNMPGYLQSLTTRVYLSLLTLLPTLSSSTISHDPTLKGRILSRARDACVGFISGSSTALCRSLPLAIDTICSSDLKTSEAASQKTTHEIDLLIHPRLPPLVRALPNLPSIVLLHEEEGKDERTARESLGLRSETNDVMDIDAPREPLNPFSIAQSPATQQAGSTAAASEQEKPDELPSVTAFVRESSDNSMANLTPLDAPTSGPENPTSISITQITKEVIEMESIVDRDMDSKVAPVAVTDPPPSTSGGMASSRTPQPLQPKEPNLRGHDSFEMAVDTDEDDIEYPMLNTESDTDSEVE